MEIWVDAQLTDRSNKDFVQAAQAPAARRIVDMVAQPASRRGLAAGFLVVLPEEQQNKENVDPLGLVFPRSASRSPLPSWYPRLPLHDITEVLSAVEVEVMQVDGGKKVSKKIKAAGSRATPPSVAAPSSKASSRSCFTKQRDGMPVPWVSTYTPIRGASLRKDFR